MKQFAIFIPETRKWLRRNDDNRHAAIFASYAAAEYVAAECHGEVVTL